MIKFLNILDLVKNMGLRYVFFRLFFIIKSKLKVQHKIFPINPPTKINVGLQYWKENLPSFFFYGKNLPSITKQEISQLKLNVEKIKNGDFIFFNKLEYHIGKEYDWITNPSTGYKYNIDQHWSEIEDLSKTAGDIKYVWEKARFSYLYDIIRYDHHYNEDQSSFVFNEIENFIDNNPINQGPNYRCSQEMSLRILNWTFSLYYYKDSKHLTETLFKKILHVIYWQLHHIYHNINFSRISVRNNHAITETLMLYLSGLLFPFIPETKKWSKAGKKWFEQEIDYQIYNDGTFLQFSMNYHRVTVQLLTWGIRLSQLHNDTFANAVYEKAKKSLIFLETSQDPVSNQLPNYGSNDGALFFKLTDDDYRNYQSQLDDLRAVLFGTVRQLSESQGWYGLQNIKVNSIREDGFFSFRESGYYIIQEKDVKTFIKCGVYKDRPAQADNLHLDVWVNGVNYLRDAGSYKYNTSKEELDYFMGTKSHNTISINGENQMLKGSRFIWYNWVKDAVATLVEKKDKYLFEGEIKAFKHIGTFTHKRKIEKIKNQLSWEVTDKVKLKQEDYMEQYWHINPDIEDVLEITAVDANGKSVVAKKDTAWYSSYYGVKIPSLQLSFKDQTGKLTTTIKIKRLQ